MSRAGLTRFRLVLTITTMSGVVEKRNVVVNAVDAAEALLIARGVAQVFERNTTYASKVGQPVRYESSTDSGDGDITIEQAILWAVTGKEGW